MIAMEIPKPITETAAWKRDHESVNTTTRWDKYPLQTIEYVMVSGKHDEKEDGYYA